MSTTPIADMWRDEDAGLKEILAEYDVDVALREPIRELCRISYFAGAATALEAMSGWQPGMPRPQCNTVAVDRVAGELTREYLTEEAMRDSAQGSEVRH
jgi:hypothetical protein